MNRINFILTCFIILIHNFEIIAQCIPCDVNVQTINVDLSAQQDTVWSVNSITRNNYCCGAVAPDNCIRFVITLNPLSDQLSFDVVNPAPPQGSAFYRINCGDSITLSDTVCVLGMTSLCLLYCKPGADQPDYIISVGRTASVSDDITLREGCSGIIWASGMVPSSINWTSVYPGAQGQYNSYLDCTTCDTVNVTAPVPIPGGLNYVDYMVSGTVTGCSAGIVQDTVRVYFISNNLLAQITPADPTFCFGSSSGVVLTVNGSGGAPPYSYLWSTGETTDSITVLTIGDYWVAITDTTDCGAAYDTVTVVEFASPISVNAGSDQTVCSNNPSATLNGIVIEADGGIWSGGNGTFTPNNTTLNAIYTPSAGEISAGSVTLALTSTGNHDCAGSSDTITITIAPEVTVNAGPDATICVGYTFTTAGSIGGSATNVTWTTSGTGTFNNPDSLSAIYTPSLADISNDSVYLIITANDSTGLCTPASDTIVLTINQATLINPATGAIDLDSAVIIFNGFGFIIEAGPADAYIWSTGETTQTITAQDSGWYWVNMYINSDYCVIIDSIYLAYQSPISLGNDTAVCYSDSITLSPGPGFSYYEWSTGDSGIAVSTIIVSGGSYSVTVTDSYGSTSTASIKINEGSEMLSSITGTDVSCTGSTDGTVDLTVSGGFPPYSYNWSNGQSLEDLVDISPGTYYVTIADTISCSIVDSVIIAQPLPLTATIVSSDVNCFEGADGSAGLTVNGGAQAYSYLWSNGQTTQNISNLAAGAYSVTVTDNNSCTTTSSITITKPTAILTAYIIPNDVNCKGGSDGSTDLTVSGGTTPYSYLWNTGATTEDLTNVPTGTYTLTVTDVNLCTTTANVTVKEASLGLTTNITGIPAYCYGSFDGSADLTVTGGTPGYTFSWNIGQISEDISGLGAGTYYVTVTDANGCTEEDSVIITEPAILITSYSVIDVLCYGGSNGQIDLTPSGGVPGYTYLWSTGSTSQDIGNVSYGAYSVTVTDANLCSIINSINVGQPSILSANIYGTDINCYDGADGTTNITAIGGTLPYSYLWSTGSSAEDLTGLSPGLYSVTVTDNNLCTTSASVAITEPLSALSASAAGTNLNCNNGFDGSINLSVAGGTAGYNYLWSNGLVSEDLLNIAAGIYSVTVTDAHSCSATTSATITEPSAITIAPSVTNSTCGSSNGSASITVTGGTGTYSYLWSTGASTNSITNLPAGAYSITVTDGNSCTGSATVSINDSNAPTSIINSSTDVLCYGSANGTASVSASGGTPPYSYYWSNGSTTISVTGLTGGTYTVSVIDNNGCISVVSVVINEPAQFSTYSILSNVNCRNGTDGSINLIVSGGTAPYTYQWNYGQTTEDLSNISAGSYSVIITDDNLCTTGVTVTITQPAAILTANISKINAKCYGQANGSINLTVSGGTALYSYLWSSGQINEDLLNIGAGIYTVTVTDVNLCTATASATITEPAVLTATISGTNVNCNGGSDGSANLTVSGGTPNYSYFWNSGPQSEDLTGLSAGAYEVTIVDSKSCNTTATVTITEPATVLTAYITKTNVKCFGGSTGTANLTVTGGTPAYSYLWNNGETTQDLSNIGAGTYSVTVNDANSCTVSANITITQPSILTAGISGTAVSCFGGSDGEADLSVSGGTPAYSYQWNYGQINQDIGNLSAGTYIVTVTDSKQCTAAASVTITQPSELTAAAVKTNVNCKGGTNGAIDLTVTGGKTPYSYSWNTGPTTQDISGLPAGTYSVIVTDANSCATSISVIITEPPANLTATVSGDNLKCKNGSDGSAEVTATGGTSPYSYLWSGGSTTKIISGIPAGTYTITVSDANLCTTVSSVTLTEPASILNVSITGANLQCYGASTGSADLIVSGGNVPYLYSWSTGAFTQDISNLAAGTYNVTVTDVNLCSKNSSVTITEPPALSMSYTKNNATCGFADGSAIVTITGGTAPYSYTWSNGSTTNSITNVTSGAYTLTVTDNYSCTQTTTVDINDNGGPNITISYHSDVDCYGDGNGTATVYVINGFAPYTYLWTSGVTTTINSGLDGGTQSVTVTDINGCISTASVVIEEPGELVLSIAATQLCDIASLGSVDLSVTGGVQNYSYQWSNGSVSQDLLNVPAGNYTVTVTDVNACTKTGTINLAAPAQVLTAAINGTNVSCNGGSDGVADLNVNGGTAPYSYLWNLGQTTQALSSLNAGTYQITVTDAVNCLAIAAISITEPAAIFSNITRTNVLCTGDASGSTDLTVSGGTPGYSYQWSNSSTTQDLANITSGIYTVTITDSNSCIHSSSATVTEPAIINASISGTNIKCNGINEGAADLSVSGGSPLYSFNWSNASTNEDINYLSQGLYIVTITDANLCTKTTSVVITQPSAITTSIAPVNVNCKGGSDGIANLSVAGGIPAYTYLWNYGQTTEDLTNIPAGTYSVTVTDANLCTKSNSVTITEPIAYLSANISKTNVSCSGGSNGAANLTVTGGTAPYTFTWSNGPVAEDISNLQIGNYSVTVTDTKGCSITASATITEPEPVLASISKTNVKCNGGASGSAVLTVTGGVQPYMYLWSNGSSNQNLNNIAAGNYTVTITDANSCTAVSSVTITQPTVISATIAPTHLTCNGQLNGAADLTVSGGSPNYTYLWNTGQTVCDLSNISGGFYEVTITDVNNCTSSASVTINEPSALALITLTTNVKCYGQPTGAINLMISGGTPNYSYNWSNSSTNDSLTNIQAGIYTVTVNDAFLCSIISSVTITQPAAALSASIIKTNVACYSDSTGAINLTVTGGILAYSYLWSNGATNQDIANLDNGAYSVTVTDANLCQTTISATITEPLPLISNTTVQNVLCLGQSTGSINLTPSGGTPGYTYLWSTGSTFEDLSNRPAGTYFITITDANTCKIYDTVIITQPDSALSISNYLITDAACNGSSTGAVDITPAGGTAPYSFLWISGDVSEDLSNKPAGNYYLTITDANSCTTTAAYAIAQPSAISVTITRTNVSCYGDSSGSVNLTVTGGTPGYMYQWNSGQTTEDLNNVFSGIYQITVTDANNCNASSSVTITQPAALTTNISPNSVNCYGGNDGSANLTIAGGTPGYSYLWSLGQTSQDLYNVQQGAYSVTVTDSKTCTIVASVTVTEPSAPLTASLTKTDVECFGNSTGAVNLTVNGGTVPYTYSWASGETTQDISQLEAGTYSVTILDNNLCTTAATIDIIQQSSITVTINKTNVKCKGNATGSVNLTTGGGIPGYSYQWNTGSTLEDLTNLTANTYTVTITDSYGCTLIQPVTITEPLQALGTSITGTNVNCYGTASGATNLTVSGGTPSYSYLWNTGQTSEDLINISNGTYEVTVTDINLCTTTSSIVITQPVQLIITPTQTNSTCGVADGSASISASGGTMPYSYIWSTGASSNSINNIPAGLYSVTVTDQKGCTKYATISINDEGAPVSSISSKTDVTCFGAANGSASISASGGTGALSYLWSNGATGSSVNGLNGGTYYVSVTDENNCISTASVVINEPEQLTGAITGTNVKCKGGITGAANLTIQGGTPLYSYLWSTGQNTEDISNISAGTYTVTITDVNLCTAATLVTINEPAQVLTLGVSGTDVLCNNGTSGSVNLTVTGGTPAYIYQWNYGQTTQDLNNIPAGLYEVSVTDANTCHAQTSVIIGESSELIANITGTNPSCNGSNNGAANLTVTGGTSPYSYIWSNGATIEDITGISAATYYVTINDYNNCSTVKSVTITQPSALNVLSAQANVKCFGGSDGDINLSVSGGTIPYSYLWNNGAMNEDLNNLTAGTYIVTVTDYKGCTITKTIAITQPSSTLTASISGVNNSCYNANNGSVNVSVSGGTPSYSYLWNYGASTDALQGVSDGTYSITVTDANNCTTVQSIIITEPAELILTPSVTGSTCGMANGAITINITGGINPYSYQWNTGGTTSSISNTGAGAYSITVTDNNSCTKSLTINVSDAGAPVANVTYNNVTCSGDNDGYAYASASGGTLPYGYLWSNGSTNDSLSNISGGIYSVTITDNNGCKATSSVSINEPALLTATSSASDVMCNGDGDGIIDITVSGGTLAYSYQWSSGETTEDIYNKDGGNYSVTVYDAHGCTAVASDVINEPLSALNSTITGTNIKCTGDNTGSANLTVTGGTSGYSYLWNYGQTSQDIINLTSGVYSVTITDANLCISVSAVTITEPALLTAAVTATDVKCKGASTGSATVAVSGGTVPYSYLWNYGQTTQDLNNINANTYSVTITDANLCNTTAQVTVTEPAFILYTNIIGTNVLCRGDNTGAANLSVTGGTPPYLYQWNNGATSEDIANLLAGIYNVTITDNNLCTTASTVTIVQPSTQLTATISGVNIKCYGESLGSINLNVNGGTAPYAYLWNSGNINQDLQNIPAGDYEVTITDANSCRTTIGIIITQPTPLILTATQLDADCFGNASGAINLTVSGGVPNYFYNWNTGQASQDLNNIMAGTYYVTVTDANLCTSMATVTITEPPALVTSASYNNVKCKGGNSGTINLTVTGGSPGYTYLWSNQQTTEDLNNLTAGTYSVTITDAHLCTSTITVTVSQPSAVLNANISKINVKCYNGSDGAAILSTNGGTPGYTYIWNSGQTTQNILNISEGIYEVTVTDVNLCTTSSSVTITEPAPITLMPLSSNSACGMPTGSATINAAGGTSPYSYLWTNGGSTNTIINLFAGIYSVTVTDNNNCTAQSLVSVNDDNAPVSYISFSSDVSCYGFTDGSATITAVGGTGNYSYLWSNNQTLATASQLAGGVYTVTVSDENNCMSASSVTIEEPDLLAGTILTTDVSCKEGADGIANLSVTGGTSPYSYSWINSAITQDISGLPLGTYYVTITDVNSCTAVISCNISQPAQALAINITKTDAQCYGNSDGSVDLSASGGTPAYSYLWNNGQTTQDLTNISTGFYEVTVTDAHQCTTNGSVIINQSSSLTTATNSTNPLCNSSADGSIELTVSGGTLPYTYSWSNGQSSEDIYNLSEGIYIVTITDSHYCSVIKSASVSDPEAISVNITAINVSCYGGANGSASLTVLGGTPPYTFYWNNSQTTEDLSGISAGVYTVNLADAHNCQVTSSVTINEPAAPLNANISVNSTSCNGGSDGSIDLSVSGGTPGYSYLWNYGQTAQDLLNLQAGNYQVTITDSHSCTTSISAGVNEPSGLTLLPSQISSTCGNANGTALISVAGGTNPYNYLWNTNPPCSTPSVANLPAGAYSVTVTDNNGCSKSATVNINDVGAPTISTTYSNVTCHGYSNGSADVIASGGTQPYSYQWSDGSSTSSVLNLDGGNYFVTVTDANGCKAVSSVEILEPDSLQISAAATDVLCKNDGNGSINLTVTGGTINYSYVWSSGQTTQDISQLNGGIYIVTVTDSHGCNALFSTAVNEPFESLFTAIDGSNVSCKGGDNGWINLNVTGGTPGYCYIWNYGQTYEDLNNIPAGTYTCTVTDFNNCTSVSTITISEPPLLSASIVQTNVKCTSGATGSANLSVIGGIPGYSFLWNTGVTSASLSVISAGTYTVTVSDANLCTSTANAIITEPVALISGISCTNIKCKGGSTGSIDLTISGGVFPYTYQWYSGQTNEDLNNIPAGAYNITVTDANLCTTANSITVFEPQNFLTASITGVNVDCYGNHTGFANLSVTGGTPDYSYIWSTGETTQDIDNLPAASYNVTVVDANQCYTSSTINILQPALLSTALFKTDVSCFNGSDGDVYLSVTGGTGPYSYYWTSGQTAEDLMNITAGTYMVTVTDVNSCQKITAISVAQPDNLVAEITGANVTCKGGNNGSINLTVTGGTPAYTYQWSNGQLTEDLYNIAAGTYIITITDAHSCTTTSQYTIYEPVSALASSISPTHVKCNGGSDGAANLTVSGGTPSYNYLWNYGQTSQDIASIPAGYYEVTITDANSCTSVSTVTITQPDPIMLIPFSNNSTCGVANGLASVTVSGGTPPYSYYWSNGSFQPTITGIFAGAYSVTITDANNCKNSVIINVNDEGSPTSFISYVTDVTCYGYSDGTATVSATGGTPPYTYLWNNGESTDALQGVSAGTYIVSVTDANNCLSSTYTIVVEPELITINTTITNVKCKGGSDGKILITIAGGIPGYTYQWSSGQTNEDIYNITAGIYTITITDQNLCTLSSTVTVSEPLYDLSLTFIKSDVGCYGGNNGLINLSVTGGTSPYSYIWNYGQTSQDLANLTANEYEVTVTDSHLCTAYESVTITEPSIILANSAVTNALCNGSADGSISLTVTGGTPSYSYLWNNGSNTANISNLIAGIYIVTITDANGCTAVKSINVNQPALLIAVLSGTDISCNSGNDGEINMTVTGGTPNYSYSWNTGDNSEDLYNLYPGSYTVTVTDSHNCTTTTSIIIEEPSSSLSTEIYQTDVHCYGSSDGTVDLNVSGGTPNYSYLWNTGQTCQDLINILAGVYEVTITDASGCITSESIMVSEPEIINISPDITLSTCGNSDGAAAITVTGGTAPYQYLWSTGGIMPVIENIPTAAYSVTVTDANNCARSLTINVNDENGPDIDITTTNVSCHNFADGNALAIPSGGTAPYTFIWSTGDTTAFISGLSGCILNVTVTDSLGCSSNKEEIIYEPDVLTLDYEVTNVMCKGDSTGEIDLTITGGTPNYAYQWSSGQTWQDLICLPAGTYIVTVTDTNMCVTGQLIRIEEPLDSLTISLTSINIDCYGNTTGSIDVTVTGGTPLYSYIWNYGQISEDLSNIGAGQYEITVTDANMCIIVDSVDLTGPEQLLLNITSTDVNCKGGSDGSINLTVNGGSPSYSYLWNYGQTTEDLNTLSAGIYEITVTDTNLCIANSLVIISEPQYTLTANIAGTDVLCFGGATGMANLIISGGTPNYSYVWNTGETSEDIGNLSGGEYWVVITDTNSCKDTCTVVLNEPESALESDISPKNISCYNGTDGAVNLTVQGGTPGYSQLWSNGSTAEDLLNVQAGAYSVTIVDANGCSVTDTVTLNQPPEIILNISSTQLKCFGDSDGSAQVSVSGGTPDYTYLWNYGQSTDFISNLTAGLYIVTVIDDNQCIKSGSTVITSPAQLVGSIVASVDANYEECNGYIAVAAAGGVMPYFYLWLVSGDTNSAISNLCPGIYTVSITDFNNCSTILSDTLLNIYPPPILNFDSTAIEGCPPLTVNFINNTQLADSYIWYFGDATTDTAKNPVHTYNYPGIYIVQLKATGPGGSTLSNEKTVTVYDRPDAYFGIVPTTVTMLEEPIHCYNFSTYGSTYLWNFGDSSTSTEFEPIHYYNDEGVYDVSLWVWSEHNCFDSLTIKNAVTVNTNCVMVVPDAFVPNKDRANSGYYTEQEYYNNEIFHPVTRKVIEYRLQIFNRWGELLFVSDDIFRGWDGYYQGKLCQQDVYVWKITWKCDNGEIYEKIGDVTLYH
ncbi:MAG: gliding motility-associated C-terminal domain-containing protein [Bacteroidia bacterium]|nr:gliding motility-associated C-terminal domain-containing protein [Bacteroidia bacterium]